MKVQSTDARLLIKPLCLFLAMWLGAAPISSTIAQGFGAIQAVRGSVEGLGQPQGEQGRPGAVPPGPGPGPEGGPGYGAGVAAGKLDTTYVPGNAALLLIIRPAQFMAAPISQLLPLEAVTAAGRQNLGVDPAEIDEVIIFADVSNPLAPAGGAVVKFKNPFRAAALPPQVRPMVQLSELNGKKYWQSSNPMLPSFYGPNNKTLLVAPDPVLRKMVETSAQPKNGPLLDRIREVPAGSDLYLAIDIAPLRGLIQMAQAQSPSPVPGWIKLLVDSASGLELNVNLVSRGPISLVVQCNDEATAQQFEMMIAASKQALTAPPASEQPLPENPIAQAMQQYTERMFQRFQPQRNGTSITLLNITADDPLQSQAFGLVAGAILGSQFGEAMKTMQGTGPMPGAPPGAAGPEGSLPPGGAPEGAPPGVVPPPGAPPAGPEGQPALPN
jgi:hypothetical protein